MILLKTFINHLTFGFAWGCSIFTFTFLTYALVYQQPTITFERTWFMTQILCSIIAGIGFTLPSMIYRHPTLSMPFKISIHMGIGLIIYIISAIIAGWIPLYNGPLSFILTTGFYIACSFVIWFIFYLYNKKQAQQINKKIKELQ